LAWSFPSKGPPIVIDEQEGPVAVHAEDLVSPNSFFLTDNSGQMVTVQPMMGLQVFRQVKECIRSDHLRHIFGLGAKSFVMLVGDKGSMIIHTKRRETGEYYKIYSGKVGFDVLPQYPLFI